jgi:hypothetical protein
VVQKHPAQNALAIFRPLVPDGRFPEFAAVLEKHGEFAMRAMFLTVGNNTATPALVTFVAEVLKVPGSRTRKYLEHEMDYVTDGLVIFGPVTFLRAFKKGSTVPMLLKLNPRKGEGAVFSDIRKHFVDLKTSNEEVNKKLKLLVPCEVSSFC